MVVEKYYLTDGQTNVFEVSKFIELALRNEDLTIYGDGTQTRSFLHVADNIEFRNVKKIIVKVQNKIKFNLLYDKNSSLQKKIKLEQLRKEVN